MAGALLSFAKKLLRHFVILLGVVLCSKRGDKVLFIMSIYPPIHSMIGSSAEWYADAVLPTLS